MRHGVEEPSLRTLARSALGQTCLSCLRWQERLMVRLFEWVCGPAFYGFGRGSSIVWPLRVAGEDRIGIGRDVYIGPGSWLEVVPWKPAADHGPLIVIGDEVGITGYCTISAASSVIIEPGVLMARYVYISDHLHRHDDRVLPIRAEGITGVRPVRIGEGAWLGQGVVVCPGVTIGRHSVIGANSVVRHDVPPYCVAAGVPAQVIRETGGKDSSC